MSDNRDVEELRRISENLAAATRELKETAASIADAVRTQSTSTVTINAGGISSGIALAGVGACLIAIVLLGGWQMRAESDRAAAQAAWVSVWQAKVAAIEAKEKANVR